MSTTAAETVTIVCVNCGTSWERPSQRGRRPLYCDACRRLPQGTRQGETAQPETRPELHIVHAPRHHKAFATLLQVCQARIPAMLVGPAGSGKSTAARQVSQALNLSFVTESCSPQMSKFDLMGFMGAAGTYTPGVLRNSFEFGGVVLLDEIDASNPAVLVTINLIASVSVGETVTFPDGAQVARHADFVLVTGANTYGDGASDAYVGREQLDAATLDRFACITWEYDEAVERVAAGNDEWTAFVQSVRAAAANMGVDLLVTPRASINGATLLRQGMARPVVENLTVWKGLDEDTRRTIRAAL